MNETARLALPLLASGQAQKEITHNEALAALDGLVQPAVASRRVTVPPAAPETGAAWIVPAAATGAWAGEAGRIASWDGGGWTFRTAFAGFLCWVADEAIFAVFRDGAWSGGWPVAALRIGSRPVLSATPVALAVPTGGSVVDGPARDTIAQLIAALRDQGVLG